jgi:hypothetical protein
MANAGSFFGFARKGEVVPPAALKGWLQATHPEFNLAAQSNPAQVIEVKGAWDDAGQIMNAMGIHSLRVKGRGLKDVLSSNTKVLVINCDGKIPEDEWEMVRQWVIKGGYLISTDWTLSNFLEKAFPATIAWNGVKTPGTVVDAEVVSRDPVLLAGTHVPRATWKLDEESEEVKIIRPDVVQVLARSYKLAQDDRHHQFENPNQSGVLACTFAYGRGRVLHLVGHFDYNSGLGFNRYVLPDAIPGAGIGLRQAIATNFLIQGLQRGK